MTMLERVDDIVKTDFGWATESEQMPFRRDMLWCKLPERHVYYFDGDGWYRLHPKEPVFLPIKGDLPHG